MVLKGLLSEPECKIVSKIVPLTFKKIIQVINKNRASSIKPSVESSVFALPQ